MKNQSISSTPSTSEVCVYKFKSWKLATKKTDCKGSSVTVQVYQITVTLQVVIQWLNRPLKNPKRLWQEQTQSCNRETPNVGKPFGNFVAFLWKQLYNRVPWGRMLAGSPLANCLNLHASWSSESPCQVKRFRAPKKTNQLHITGSKGVFVVGHGDWVTWDVVYISSRIYDLSILAT